MAEFTVADQSDPSSAAAGLRELSPVENLIWHFIELLISTDEINKVIEVSIPITTLWPSGLSTDGESLGLVAMITNSDGTAYSNQFLPDNTAFPVMSVSSFRVVPLN